MTDEELDRMRAYVQAAEDDAGWGRAYAQDVPELLDELERLTGALDQVANDGSLEPIERRQIATHALAGVVYAEPVPHDKLWHRLRFAEMVLDRLDAGIDGVPWREAARLSESLDGEPVTDTEPLEKRLSEALHVEVPDAVEKILVKVAPPADLGVKSTD